MPEIHRFFGHPLFFVHDATMELSSSDIPEIADREPPLIWKTERVLAVGTIPDVDGEVQIVLDHGPELVGNLVFSGRLPTPSGTLAVTHKGQPKRYYGYRALGRLRICRSGSTTGIFQVESIC
jgi:hypothetical protein